jgi:hypothetical protein
MTRGCQDTGCVDAGWQASGGLAESTDVGIGSDEEVRLSGAVIEVGCYLDELVADIETCGEKDHGGEECDCVHSCIFLIVNIIIFCFCLENQLLIVH